MSKKIGSWLRDEPIVVTAPPVVLTLGIVGSVLYFGAPKLKRGQLVQNLGLKLENGDEYLIRWSANDTRRILSGATLSAGDKVEITGATRLDFVPPFCSAMYVDPLSITKLGNTIQASSGIFELDHITFGDEDVVLDNGTERAIVTKTNWTAHTGYTTKFFFNQVKPFLAASETAPVVLIEGNYRITYEFDRESRTRIERRLVESEEITVIRASGFDRIEEIAVEIENNNRLTEFFTGLRAQADSIWMMSRSQIQSYIDGAHIRDLVNVDSVHEHLRAEMTRSDYDPTYFQYLMNHATLEGVNEEGFIFDMGNDYCVFKIPVAGAATYIFKGNPQDIMNYINEIRQANVPTEMVTRDEVRMTNGSWKMPLIRMKAANPTELEWFIGRAIHTDNSDAWVNAIQPYVRE